MVKNTQISANLAKNYPDTQATAKKSRSSEKNLALVTLDLAYPFP